MSARWSSLSAPQPQHHHRPSSRPPARTSTRDAQLLSRHIQTVHGVALRMSAANKRRHLIETHLSSLLCRRAAKARQSSADHHHQTGDTAAPADPPAAHTVGGERQFPRGRAPPGLDPTTARGGGSASYWRETASTLSRENATITEQLGRLRADNAHLRESLRRLSAAHKETEQALAESNKELAHLSLVSRHWTGGAPFIIPLRSKVPPVPVDPQGKDAMHWYLSCRHMEAQFNLLQAELENKIAELTEIISANKRKRDDGAAAATAREQR